MIIDQLFMSPLERLHHELTLLLEHALAARIATSASLSVSFGDAAEPAVRVHRGQTQGEKTSDRALYDLASLTKIIGTTLATAHTVTRGHIDLTDVPYTLWPHASVQNILAHKAGLPAHRRFYELLALSTNDFRANRSSVFANLFCVDPCEDRSTRLYSDLGFMGLGLYLERSLHRSLFEIFSDAWKLSRIKTQLRYYPSKPLTYLNNDPRIVPTGYCRARRRNVVGQVHDPNCYYMGGLLGHAGLFGTLGCVDACGRYFLRAFQRPQNDAEHLLKYFAREGLGFDKPSTTGTTRYFSREAFGHFGYTGTSLWIDPQWNEGQGVVISLLTNRVHCNDKPEAIFWLRMAVNRALKRWSLSLQKSLT